MGDHLISLGGQVSSATGPTAKRFRDMGDNSVAEVVSLPGALPAEFTANAVFDARAFGTVTLSVITAPSSPYALQWSPNNVNWPASGVSNVTGIDLDFNTWTNVPTTIAVPEAITVQGGGYFRLSGGTGGTFMISGGAVK